MILSCILPAVVERDIATFAGGINLLASLDADRIPPLGLNVSAFQAQHELALLESPV